jgi:hypothetical protein
MKIKYCEKRFGAEVLAVIDNANKIIEEYETQGFELTLRQLYYQFVARGLLANKQTEYARLGDIINNARLAGLVDWDAIVDRTRNLQGNQHWDSPRQIVNACISGYQLDRWEGQEYHVEVWIEKDALVGVIEKPCRELDVSFFSCRGYTSQSEMWSAAMRLERYKDAGQQPVVIHLGDHDPSGKDMTRDIEDRMQLFMGGIIMERIALNMNQIEKYNPPPNPAKITDPRATKYIDEFGQKSWELDALDPRVIAKLITKTVRKYRDDEKWEEVVTQEERHKKQLERMAAKLD